MSLVTLYLSYNQSLPLLDLYIYIYIYRKRQCHCVTLTSGVVLVTMTSTSDNVHPIKLDISDLCAKPSVWSGYMAGLTSRSRF